jgi:hypothetical protein
MRLHHSAARLMLKLPAAVCRMGFLAPAKNHLILKDQRETRKTPETNRATRIPIHDLIRRTMKVVHLADAQSLS